MPRPYPPEFRQRALDLVCSARSVAEVAELLGIAVVPVPLETAGPDRPRSEARDGPG
jgi:hypothetical protein